jgi:hypothetical protein
MEALLIGFSICVLGLTAALILFSVAMRGRKDEKGLHPLMGPSFATGGFFLENAAGPDAQPSDVLLLQLERHFRLEEKAATEFLEGPSVESLHAPSFSPLWN